MKTRLCIILIVSVLQITAQPIEKPKTIFGNRGSQLGFYISPSFQAASTAGSMAILPGVGAGLVFNNNMYLGLHYKYITTENTPVGESDNRLYLEEYLAGLRYEYSIMPEKSVHVNFPLEFGIGHIELDLKDSYEDSELSIPDDDATFAYLEPGVAIELNIWTYIKLDVGIGYRLVNKVSFRNLSEKDLMGITYTAALKMGVF
jgi:hypothetical protein